MSNMKIKVEISYKGTTFDAQKFLAKELIENSKLNLRNLISFTLLEIKDDIIKSVLDKFVVNHEQEERSKMDAGGQLPAGSGRKQPWQGIVCEVGEWQLESSLA